MRQCMVHAFSEQLIKMDGAFQEAIAKACRPEAVQQIIDEAAVRYLNEALDEEVKSFLLYGEGRKLVRAEVEKRLKAELGDEST